MQTQTHLLLASAVLGRRARPGDNAAVIAGALAPDISIYVLFVWGYLIARLPGEVLWTETYWAEPWQTLSAISNSVPLFAALAAAAFALNSDRLKLFSIAALSHVALDLPVHADDAHRHFWPLTDWRFQSPLSYWDAAYNAGAVSFFESALGIVAIIILWRRFQALWVRTLLGLAFLGYMITPILFMGVL